MVAIVSKTIKEADKTHAEIKKVLLTLKRSARNFKNTADS